MLGQILIPGSVAFVILLVLALSIRIARLKWQEWKRRQRGILMFIIGWHILLLWGLVLVIWPATPWGSAQLPQMANEFMTHLSSSDTSTAVAMIENPNSEIVNRLQDPANRPVTWKFLANASRDYVADGWTLFDGSAFFPNGKEYYVILGITWKWEKAIWQIFEVGFDPFGHSGFHSATESTGVPYESFRGVTIAVGIISIIFSMRWLLGNQPQRIRRNRRGKATTS